MNSFMNILSHTLAAATVGVFWGVLNDKTVVEQDFDTLFLANKKNNLEHPKVGQKTNYQESFLQQSKYSKMSNNVPERSLGNDPPS